MDLKQWWDKAHKENINRWVSDYGKTKIHKLLNVDVKGTVLIIGTGRGTYVKEMFKDDCTIDAMDITESAFDKVNQYLRNKFIFPCSLPESEYDYIIHHLVAQHMSDNDLLIQLKEMIKSLKSNGILGIQFSEGKKYNDLEAQMKGGVRRTIKIMNKLIRKAGGEIVWLSEGNHQYEAPKGLHDPIKYYCEWYGIQVKRV